LTAPIESPPVITVGELEIDVVKRAVRAGGSDMCLTPMEVGQLHLLAARSGRVLTREEILDTLWGTDNRAETNVVDQHVRSLSARLQTDGRLPRFIAMVPGRGYQFLPSGRTA
jgi:DNA-binding response OmpR family regulator